MAEWSRSIFGCFADFKWCLMTCCCPFVTSYTVANKIGKKTLGLMSVIFCILFVVAYSISGVLAERSPKLQEMRKDSAGKFNDIPNDSYWTASQVFAAIALMTGTIFVIIIAKIRGAFRDEYSIEGGSLGDFCLSCCCNECVLCQMKNHMEDMEIDRV